ncbi:hypothetical protein MCUN1_001414 [Malassezia cuniculi]|uniref:Glycoside hydrolase family 5 C-terminal domain-containing protein n=1 Tax=Malassezia cuniculi TaxID=948313 RepID=A0AAF0J5T9_9BASI|nr:hypothetical protein MCUN1_001414 [Malassezia cuniculi]
MVAQDLSVSAIGRISVDGAHLRDEHGRVLLLRGVNVSGVSKLPSAPDALVDAEKTHTDPEAISFVDRPFPLAEAPAHFARMREWGLTLVRLLVTWEALSHDGPYPQHPIDAAYVDYLKALLDTMASFGIRCIICPHQDIWSRVTGGSGAPAWTLRAAGFDLERLNASGAAYVPDAPGSLHSTPPKGKAEPTGAFIWPSGYQKLAPATMATLFWGGRTFAPKLGVRVSSGESVNIQDYLQDAFIGAFGALADALGSHEALLAFEAINEPHRGYINLHSWGRWKYETDLHIGHFPSPLQSMALGDGHALDIPFYVKSWPFPSRVSHYSRVDPRGSAWLQKDDPRYPTTRSTPGCIWAEHGVWKWDATKEQPVVLQGDYFNVDPRPGHGGRRVEWYRDFYAPFVRRFSERVSGANRMFLVEPIPNEFMPPWSATPVRQTYTINTTIDTRRPDNMVYAPHFYDLNVLFFKTHGLMSVNVQGLSRGMFILFGVYFGRKGLLRNYCKQINTLVALGRKAVAAPTIIGEVGIPFDVNGGEAMRTGDYRVQHELMYTLVSALEQSFASFTLWNYNPSNTAATGDGWNMEDFSIINLEPHAADRANKLSHDELYRGGRTLDAIIRPYVSKVAGTPLRTRWDASSATLHFAWIAAERTAPTEVFVPRFFFDEVHVQLSSGTFEYRPDEQTLYVTAPPGRQTISISNRAHETPASLPIVVAIIALLLALVLGAYWA